MRYEERGNRKFFYFYDASGNLSAIRYYNANGVSYDFFTLTNQQGDVISIYDSTGSLSAKYEYDAWGKVISVKNASGTDISTNENHIANLNPIRYRGYYYDTETKLYYLQSRYYNPQVGRFLNADNQLNNDILGLNTFSYCSNNPISNIDPTGHDWYHWAIAAGVVAGLAIATVATAGTFAFGMTALGFATMGISVGGTTGALALATVGSATALTACATFSFFNANTVEDFKNQGNWGTVTSTLGAGVFNYAYTKYTEPKTTPVIGKMPDLNKTKIKNNEFKVADQLPNMGSPKANWKQNSGVLRSYMDGRAFKDVSIYPRTIRGRFCD